MYKDFVLWENEIRKDVLAEVAVLIRQAKLLIETTNKGRGERR